MTSTPNQSPMVKLLEDEFPKLRTLTGGWLFHKATGGSGQRKLSLIPPESEGYTGKQLKSASNGGKNVLYIIPLQEELDTTPLPLDSREFSKMPHSVCKKCGSSMPLQLLALHLDECVTEMPTDTEDNVTVVGDEDTSEDSDGTCPFCLNNYPVGILPVHASVCADGLAQDIDGSDSAGSSRPDSAGCPSPEEQDSELSKSGILGLHALLQKKLCYLKSHMSSVRQLYGSVLDNCEVCEKLQDDDYLDMDEDYIQLWFRG